MIKRYSIPKQLHGNLPGHLHMYLQATGDTVPFTPRPPKGTAPTLSPVSSPVTEIDTTTAVATNPLTTTVPTTTTQTTTETTGATIVTSPVTSPVLSGATAPESRPPQVQTVIVPIVAAGTYPSGGGYGGGGGGFGASSDQGVKAMETVKKKSIFPWILIAAGVYMIIKQPLK